jgi:hypothetical protein
MIRLVFNTVLAMIAFCLIAFPQQAYAFRNNPPQTTSIICAATYEYRGQEISVRRIFKPDGTEITEPAADSTGTVAGDDPIMAKIRQQLFDYVTVQSKNLATDCSPNNPEDGNEIHVFDCSVYWREGSNHFSIGFYKAEWRYEEGTDWRMRLEWFSGAGHDWTVNGFPDRDHKSQSPTLSAFRPPNWPAANYTVPISKKKYRLHRTEVSQISVGKQTVRQWTDTNLFHVAWNQWPTLMQGEGDVEFKVYDTKKGVLLQKTFPRTFLSNIEANMKTGYQTMIAKARDNLTQCKRLDSWEGGEDQAIVVT